VGGGGQGDDSTCGPAGGLGRKEGAGARRSAGWRWTVKRIGISQGAGDHVCRQTIGNPAIGNLRATVRAR